MRNIRSLIFVAGLSLLCGCAAIGSRVAGEKYFAGVRNDYKLVFDSDNIPLESRTYPAIALVDMPFSLVGDILLLPYDALSGSPSTNEVGPAWHE